MRHAISHLGEHPVAVALELAAAVARLIALDRLSVVVARALTKPWSMSC
jgi:hypothetical protein